MSSRPRGPGFTYAALSIVLIVLVGIIALTTRQPPPPTIAEFAPQAVEQIVDSPEDQAARRGANGAGQPTPEQQQPDDPAAAPAPIDVPRVRKCVGDPPRQIEDPQSPPCVPYWAGDNGGSTYRGVTRDEIRIAIPGGSSRRVDALIAFFNKRFEFYGRKLVASASNEGGQSIAGIEADAANVAEEVKAFASVSYPDRQGAEVLYMDALARRGVLSVNSRPVWRGEDEWRKHAPFEWTYLPGANDFGNRVLGEWTCKQLAGRSAEYSPSVSTQQRKFGLVTTSHLGLAPDVRPLDAELARCGASIAERVNLEDGDAGQGQNAAVQMKLAGVTSVICVCHSGPFIYVLAGATNQAYFPEWIINSYMYWDQDIGGHLAPAPQRNQFFGQTSRNRNNSVDQLPSTWALQEIDPSFGKDSDATSNNAGDYGLIMYSVYYYEYPDWLMLASGIQMAGPKLTPQTFESGLFKTRFPNPGADVAPYYQARVGFASSHQMIQSAATIWWSPSDYSYYMQANGAWCYAQAGKRYSPGQWPTDQVPMFRQPCR